MTEGRVNNSPEELGINRCWLLFVVLFGDAAIPLFLPVDAHDALRAVCEGRLEGEKDAVVLENRVSVVPTRPRRKTPHRCTSLPFITGKIVNLVELLNELPIESLDPTPVHVVQETRPIAERGILRGELRTELRVRTCTIGRSVVVEEDHANLVHGNRCHFVHLCTSYLELSTKDLTCQVKCDNIISGGSNEQSSPTPLWYGCGIRASGRQICRVIERDGPSKHRDESEGASPDTKIGDRFVILFCGCGETAWFKLAPSETVAPGEDYYQCDGCMASSEDEGIPWNLM